VATEKEKKSTWNRDLEGDLVSTGDGTEKTRRRGRWVIIGCGLLYGGFARMGFGVEVISKWIGGPASVAFLFFVPFAMGALVAFLGMTLSDPKDRNVRYWSFGAPSACLWLGVLVSLVTGFEAFFCVLVASPILWLLTILGGVFTATLVDRLGSRGERFYVSMVLLLPYFVGPVEQMIELPEEILTVENRIEIHASPEEIWNEIKSVPAISKKELRWSWVHALGFPRPIAAVLEGEGIGAVRVATFERNVSFFERVTEWVPGQAIAFSIEADPQFVPANAFDQHVIVGGRFYDVLDGRYEIETGEDGKVVLHLSSRHRLNTHLGGYASWWSERIMEEIQGNILEVVKRRAER
jgi:hypothetical protein